MTQKQKAFDYLVSDPSVLVALYRAMCQDPTFVRRAASEILSAEGAAAFVLEMKQQEKARAN